MTNAVIASLRQLADDLNRIEARWALIGGFAVSARAEPRFTRDVDVCVLVHTDSEAEGVAHALVRLDYSVASIVEHEHLDRLATLRLVSPVPGGVLVDLLFASSGIEAEIVASAETLDVVPGVSLPVARRAHLVVLKVLARDDDTRPQDRLDLLALRHTLTVDDATEVRRLAALVVDRGFARDRDMIALVEDYLSSG